MGVGFCSTEYPAEKLFRDSKIFELYEGQLVGSATRHWDRSSLADSAVVMASPQARPRSRR